MHALQVLVFVVLLLVIQVIEIQTNLRFVHVAWRHGDRTPVEKPYKWDTNNQIWTWPLGIGQLTKKGMREHYVLGAYFRRRYIEGQTPLLSKTYNSSQIYVLSTDVDRTIMSAIANLAGMYPVPSGAKEWKQGLKWHPIPVHTAVVVLAGRPAPETVTLRGYGCKPAVEKAKVERKEAVKKWTKKNEHLFQFLKIHITEFEPTGGTMHTLFDQFNCQRFHNDTHKWPDWMNNTIFENIRNVLHEYLAIKYSSRDAYQYSGPFMLYDIALRSKKASAGNKLNPPGLKYFVYSAHDTTLMKLLATMGAFDGRLPPYASAVMFELHAGQQPDDDYVEVFYINETGSENPIPITDKLTGCLNSTNKCTVDKFFDFAKGAVPQRFEKFCKIGEEEPKDKDISGNLAETQFYSMPSDHYNTHVGYDEAELEY